MSDPVSDLTSVRDVTEHVREALDTLRQRLAAAQIPETVDDEEVRGRLSVTFDALRDTHTDLLNLATYLRVALDDFDALEKTDERASMDQDDIDDLADEMDDLGTRIDEMMEELRDRRSRDESTSGNGRS